MLKDTDVIPKSMAESCMQHGYCTAELNIWHIMKQLILPPDVNEVTMHKEILTLPKTSPSTLDQASKCSKKCSTDTTYASRPSKMFILKPWLHL